MNRTISKELLRALSEFVSANLGLYFPPERWSDLQRGVLSACRDLRVEQEEPCIHKLLSSTLTKSQIEILASHLTVGETYFLREKKSFDALTQFVLPELIRLRGAEKRLRIWSAGCSTGEEAYSIAIVLKEFPQLRDWNLTVLATDINPRALHKAVEGRYREWSFRGTPKWLRERYFTSKPDGSYQIAPDIQRMVAFGYLNLAEDVYPSLVNNTNAMDIIFCRNVLMYFTLPGARRVMAQFEHCLVDGGWIVVSPVELSHVEIPSLTMTHFPGAVLFQKLRGKPAAAQVPAMRYVVEEPFIVPQPRIEPMEEAVVPAAQAPFDERCSPAAAPAPSTPQSRYARAERLYEQGDYAGAIDQLLGLFGENPRDTRTLLLLARAHANSGKLDEALKWSEKAIALDRLDPRPQFLRATIFQEQGRVDDAMNTHKQVLYLDPDFILAHFALGNLARQQGDLKLSQIHLQNARTLLGAKAQEEILPESEGMTAGRLKQVIESMLHSEVAA